MKCGCVQESFWCTVAAKASIPKSSACKDGQSPSDKCWALHTTGTLSLVLQACSFWCHSPAARETHILPVPSVFIPPIGTQTCFPESSMGAWKPLSTLQDPGKKQCLFPVCWPGGGWKSAGTNYNYLFISEMWPVDVSVQTLLFSNAQLGIKLPSAPWVGSGQSLKGTEPLSITNVNCLVLPWVVTLVERSRIAQGPTHLSSAF